MEVTHIMLLIVCPAVFFASFVDAIAGGGGLISLPVYLIAGLPPALAAGTNKFSACMGTATATLRYARGRKIAYGPALFAVLGALPSAYLGAQLLQRLSDSTVKTIVVVVLPIAAIAMLVRRKPPAQTTLPALTPPRMLLSFAIGAAVGFYDGLVGPGTGTFLILLLTSVLGMDLVTASGSAKLVNLASNAAALFSLVLGGNVLFALGIPAMLCSVAGGLCGSSFALKHGARAVRALMLLVFIGLLVKLVYDLITKGTL